MVSHASSLLLVPTFPRSNVSPFQRFRAGGGGGVVGTGFRRAGTAAMAQRMAPWCGVKDVGEFVHPSLMGDRWLVSVKPQTRSTAHSVIECRYIHRPVDASPTVRRLRTALRQGIVSATPAHLSLMPFVLISQAKGCSSWNYSGRKPSTSRRASIRLAIAPSVHQSSGGSPSGPATRPPHRYRCPHAPGNTGGSRRGSSLQRHPFRFQRIHQGLRDCHHAVAWTGVLSD